MIRQWDKGTVCVNPFDTLRERAAHVFLNNSEEGWSYWDHTAGRFLKGE